ncbi:unnamed protein product [Dracunculus medinensis]|uniref:TPR_REGION domain-containing protein n=1 Tax=Dracunculus medinensis TaxID=318479 RepID=A0A158Q5U2_DRAME|nr:unnamed protein product [Dracunculus medinensis]
MIKYHSYEWKKKNQRRFWCWNYAYDLSPLLGLSWLVTLKDFFGIKPISLDDDPIKVLFKAWLLRKKSHYDEAVEELHKALGLAEEKKQSIPITRIYDELANTYYEMGNLKDAETLFRVLLKRLVELHGKHQKDPEFIAASLKLSDIYAQKNEIDKAETGYQFCTSTQNKIVEEHVRNYSSSGEIETDFRNNVEQHGTVYTDPLSLFGMCLEQYAHFLVKYRDESRLKEAENFMDEAVRLSHHIFGPASFHTVNMLNNFGAVLINKNRFELARKFLEIGIDRILYINECSSLVPGYFCNYAEALFHCGEK